VNDSQNLLNCEMELLAVVHWSGGGGGGCMHCELMKGRARGVIP
jgi:hypothetical protein